MRPLKQTLLIVTLLVATNIYSQNTTIMTNQDRVKTFLNGFNHPEHIQKSLDLLADDYKFKNPVVSLNSKTEFIALAQEIGKVLTGLDIVTIAENGAWVAAHYVFKSSIPGLETNQATEWFRLEHGIIKESILIYDASQWRKFYEKMNH